VQEFDPLEFIPRAYDYWERTRWPGRTGRERYAQGLYAAFMLRQLEQLSLRIWDDREDRAGERLSALQDVLFALNASQPPAVFVRDARWLIPIAQGPRTRNLAAYFRIADQITRSMPGDQRLGVHRANARLAGGHLRSQLRYLTWQTGRPAGDPANLVVTRNSNALDGALLLRDLVALLNAYAADRSAPQADRLDLADAILQGLSADPQLFLIRLDLLAPYTMIEHLFVTDGASSGAAYTLWGWEHLTTLAQYRDLLGTLAPELVEDAKRLDPAGQPYSPLGIAYGFCADLLSNIAWDHLVSNPLHDLSLEDMFASANHLDEKRARAEAWAQLPRRDGERAHFEHSDDAARENFARLTAALAARAKAGLVLNASDITTARIVVSPSGPDSVMDESSDLTPAQDHCFTSDLRAALAGAATHCPAAQIREDRNEGRYLASREVDGHWRAVSKVILTLLTAEGRHAVIRDMPAAMIDVMQLTCPDIVDARATERTAHHAPSAAQPADR
jgi:hypothetical protein